MFFFLFFHSVGNVIIPTDELIFFKGVGSTTNQYWVYGRYIEAVNGVDEPTPAIDRLGAPPFGYFFWTRKIDESWPAACLV